MISRTHSGRTNVGTPATRRRRLSLVSLESRIAPAFGPIGPEFRINSFTTGEQREINMAADAVGNFVAVWVSSGQDGSGTAIIGKRFSAGGAALTGEFVVNNLVTSGDQVGPSVAVDPDGDFVVTWTSSILLPNGTGSINARRYNTAGVAQGDEFIVYGDSSSGSEVAMRSDATGGFIITWTQEINGSDWDIYQRRYDATGNPLAGPEEVNNPLGFRKAQQPVAYDANGDYAIAWTTTEFGFYYGIYAKRYFANGTPKPQGQIRVDQNPGTRDGVGSLGMAPDGSFICVWTSYLNPIPGGANNDTDVVARRFTNNGIGFNEFRVNTFTTGKQESPRVQVSASGDFVITWESENQDGDGLGIYGQRYGSTGLKVGPEFRVSTYTLGDQGGRGNNTALAMDSTGNFVAGWTSYRDQDCSGAGIYAQRFKEQGTPTMPAHVLSVQINNDCQQRSMVTRLVVTFDQLITLGVTPTAAFELKRQSDNAIVALDADVLGNAVVFTITGGTSDGISLADGRYILTVFASQVNAGAFDGNGDGTPGDNYTLVGTPANGLFRLLGDANGDGTVAANDFIQFRLAFGGSNSIFDFDNDGSVSASDFIQFRLRFGGSI